MISKTIKNSLGRIRAVSTANTNITVLDGYTLNPGDLSWEGLEELGDCTVYDRTPPDQIIARAREAKIVLTNKTPLTADTLAALPRLKYIGVLATGYNVVDIDAARARGIPVTNVPDYSTPSVAQAVFAHLLNLTHQVAAHSRSVRDGEWVRSPDFCYWKFPLVELDDLTMGLVGYGRIGQAVGRIALAMGMRLLVHTRTPGDLPDGAAHAELDDLFRQSDVISLHCPLTDDTFQLVDARRLALIKPGAYLINTGRGALIDESALAAALDEERIAGAGLDVLSSEPPTADNPLLTAKNCYITPHLAWATRAARERLMGIAVANVRAFLAGRPENVVNGVV